jgi:hypothetical protein
MMRIGSTGDKDIVASSNSLCQNTCLYSGEHLAFDQIAHRKFREVKRRMVSSGCG